jgi:hypothetical protein
MGSFIAYNKMHNVTHTDEKIPITDAKFDHELSSDNKLNPAVRV